MIILLISGGLYYTLFLEKDKFTIVVRSDTPTNRYAAEELKSHLSRVYSHEFEIKDAPSNGSNIFIGNIPNDIPSVDPSNESISIKSDGDDLILAGSGSRGTLYAVYTYLEDFIGYHWFSDKVTHIPDRSREIIPSNLNLNYKPPFRLRLPYWKHVMDNPEFAARIKTNGSELLKDEKFGGYESFGGVHSFYRLIPPSQWFDTHPEWFSLIDNVRTHEKAQLCLSNTSMQKEMLKQLRELFSSDSKPNIYSVSQNDWAGYCECELCTDLATKYGGQSGLMIWFINRLAEKIKLEFPKARISTLAYKYSQDAPSGIKPLDNVVVQLCSIKCDFSVPLTHPKNKDFSEDCKNWSEICDNLYIWNYAVNFRYHMIPHPNLQVLGENIEFFKNHNVIGILEQGAYTTLGTEFAELRAWLLARLLWNPNLDANKLIDTFIKGYYGEAAAQDIWSYINIMQSAVSENPEKLDLYAKLSMPFLSIKYLRPAWIALSAAKDKVADHPGNHSRVESAMLPLLYIILVKWPNLKAEASAKSIEWPFANSIDYYHREFLRIAKAHNVTQLHEGKSGFHALKEIVSHYNNQAGH